MRYRYVLHRVQETVIEWEENPHLDGDTVEEVAWKLAHYPVLDTHWETIDEYTKEFKHWKD